MTKENQHMMSCCKYVENGTIIIAHKLFTLFEVHVMMISFSHYGLTFSWPAKEIG